MVSDYSSPVIRILQEEDSIVITWNDGEQSVFAHTWLRENAPENRFSFGRAELDGFSDHTEFLSPWSVSIEYDETLVISWAGLREVNRFSLDDLRNSRPVVDCAELALAAD